MNTDISKALSYEIRKELADRYFGFRSLIEQEKEALSSKVKDYTLTIEQKTAHDLVRIYMLLADKGLIDRFFILTGLNEDIFFDPYTIKSATIRERLFADFALRGLTRAGRFKRLFLSLYDSLASHIEDYRAKINSLSLDHATVVEEIELFSKKNDLSHIMTFLRSLDASNMPGHEQLNVTTGMVSPDNFEKKMQVTPPDPIEQALSIIPPIPPLHTVKKSLKQLTRDAYNLNKDHLPYDPN